MNKTLSQLIRSTKEYSNVCDTCKEEILIYPTISGRTEYTQDEVEQITLKRIIDTLQAKEQECEKLNNDNRYFVNQIISLESLADKYKLALEEIEQTINNFPPKEFRDAPQTRVEYTVYLLSVSETKLRKVLGIIDEVKGQCYG